MGSLDGGSAGHSRGLRSADQALIQPEVLIRHPFRAESFLERAPAFSPVEIPDQWQHADHLIEAFTSESCDMVANHVRRVFTLNARTGVSQATAYTVIGNHQLDRYREGKPADASGVSHLVSGEHSDIP
ncbi:MAG: hypothetical protein ABIR36_16400 [Nitrospiraceae bacterium]